MRVLMISRDPTALIPGSSANVRLAEYSLLVDDLRVIVLGKNWNIFGSWDVVTAQDPFETGLVAFIMAILFRSKLQLQIHTDFLNPVFSDESFLNRVRVLIAKFLLPRADCVRVVSKRILDSLKTHDIKLRSEPVILPIYVDVNNIMNTPASIDLGKKYPQFEVIVLMASRLTKEKNLNLALEAMRAVVPMFPKTGLVIVGDGPEEASLKKNRDKYDLRRNVVFENWTEDLPSYLKTADIYLLTSSYEGYGRTLVEAAASGCPIITTDVGLSGELLTPEDVIVVPAKNVQALAEALMRLVGSPPLRRKLSERCRVIAGRLPSKEDSLRMYKQSWLTCGK
jgi:glycosyltransferase involved in cell wall biosynthesis